MVRAIALRVYEDVFYLVVIDSFFIVYHYRVPSAADTGYCALEIGKCQPQYRIQQHKMTQQRLI